jgi:hypothetical protein
MVNRDQMTEGKWVESLQLGMNGLCCFHFLDVCSTHDIMESNWIIGY